MRMLVQRTAISADLPFTLAALKMHLRVDFDDDDAALTDIGLTAAAEIEHVAQIALLTQTIRVTVFDPARSRHLSLPVGPVADDAEPAVTIDGTPFAGFDFAAGLRPLIRWQASYLALTPTRVVIDYPVGFGDTAADIPRDLAQALMDQAGMHYDGRSPVDARQRASSPHMARIAARYRGVAA